MHDANKNISGYLSWWKAELIPRAAVTGNYKLGDLKQQKIFSHDSGDCSMKSMYWQRPVSSKISKEESFMASS